jgi:transcriptional regulator with XRE-family HTH domain
MPNYCKKVTLSPQEMNDLKSSGLTIDEIAASQGVSRQRIHQILKENGFPTKCNSIDATINRIKRHVKVCEGDCWMTEHFSSPPRTSVEGKCVFVHRLFYEKEFGEIPERMQVFHKCKKPWCVNPEHLYVGEPGMHVSRGVNNPLAKLTEEQVREIRKRLKQGERKKRNRKGFTNVEIAKEFNVSDFTVSMIRNGNRYATVSDIKEGDEK